jgi:hypothetical protein
LIGDSVADGTASGGGTDHVDGSRGNDLLFDDNVLLSAGGEVGDGNGDLVAGGKGNDELTTSGDDRCIGGKGIDTDMSKPVCPRSSGIDANDPGKWPGTLLDTVLAPFLP